MTVSVHKPGIDDIATYKRTYKRRPNAKWKVPKVIEPIMQGFTT